MPDNDGMDRSVHPQSVLQAFSFETVTITSDTVRLTASLMTPAGAPAAKAAYITTETEDVRYRFDGGLPTATVGHFVAALGKVTLSGINNLDNSRWIRDTGAAADVVLAVTYMR